ncbi:hypothetical protein JAAARDRAFT_30645 [Jaapia argillacea MUCL 33604]|uniref:SnoaL-like domain-containing protein n=1 Tax=Jaapia argillacea MUCL 33604 TaxID=933084 RepID=A0A067Q993_9AGAM|nr:hypothetical protein JAAARDRAFT_30645 [Jaapia argillacea MUCL 33604]
MTSAIVLPNLTQWTESRITAILKATSTTDFDQAFDAFIAPDAQITVNGAPLTRDQYKQQLAGEGLLEALASVTFNGAVEVPTDGQLAGTVGVFYVATIVSKLLIDGAPAESTITSSLNVVIKQYPTGNTGPPPPIRGYHDYRKVATLDQVFVGQPVPVHFAGIPSSAT